MRNEKSININFRGSLGFHLRLYNTVPKHEQFFLTEFAKIQILVVKYLVGLFRTIEASRVAALLVPGLGMGRRRMGGLGSIRRGVEYGGQGNGVLGNQN